MRSPRRALLTEDETRAVPRRLIARLAEAVRAEGFGDGEARVAFKLNDRDALVVAAVLEPRYRGEWIVLLPEEQQKLRMRRSQRRR